MSRLSVPRETADAVQAHRRRLRPAGSPGGPEEGLDGALARLGEDETRVPADVLHDLRRQVGDLQRELAGMRTERRRDMATARGLGEALQALRRGMTALRTENEDLRRRLALRDRAR